MRIEENDDLEELEAEQEEEQEDQDINVSTITPDSPMQPVQVQAQPYLFCLLQQNEDQPLQEGYLSAKVKRKQSGTLKLTLCSN